MMDLHTHTYLCGHAEGMPEDYINTAIERGITIYGISDHAPLPDGMREGITMHESEAEGYIELVHSLKEHYAGRIDIRTGFEVDYPEQATFSEAYYTDERIDYLIGSCHFLGDWPIDMPERLDEYDVRGVDAVVEQYLSNMLAMVKSRKYNIIGHFDLFKKFGHRPKKSFRDMIAAIAEEARINEVAIEINTSGLRKPVGEMYPSDDIVALFAREGAPFTLGSDSHAPLEVGRDFDKALAVLAKHGVTELSSYRMRNREVLTI